MVMDIGRVCVKIAGRDSGKLAVIVKKIDNNFVLIDGNVRRKKCNLKHLEPTENILEINEEEPTENLLKIMEKAGLKVEKKLNSKKKEKPKKKENKK